MNELYSFVNRLQTMAKKCLGSLRNPKFSMSIRRTVLECGVNISIKHPLLLLVKMKSLGLYQVSYFLIPLTHYLSGKSEEHTSELQSRFDLVCRLLLEKK